MLMPTSAHPKSSSRYKNLFSDDKTNVADSGSDIINKIKLAERIYDNNTKMMKFQRKLIRRRPRNHLLLL